MMVGLAKTGLVAGVLFLGIAPLAASAQTAAKSKSERGMPEKTPGDAAKSERAMPDQTKDSGTPAAKSERAMPTPDKK